MNLVPKYGVWLDHRGVAPSAVRVVKNYRPHLDISFLPIPNGDYHWSIVSRILVPHDGGGAIVRMMREYFPVLFIPHAMYADDRWIAALEANRFNAKKDIDDYWNKHAMQLKQLEAEAERAAEELYPALRKDYGMHNMSAVRATNPYDKTKMLQDKLGRELR